MANDLPGITHNPLVTLQAIAEDPDQDPRARVSAAKALAEYTHKKQPTLGIGGDVQTVNIVMLIGEDKPKCPQIV